MTSPQARATSGHPRSSTRHRVRAVALAAAGLVCATFASAQVAPPTPGAVQDSVPVRRTPFVATPPEVLFSRDAPATPRSQTQRFLVSGFTFKGNTQFSEAMLRQLTEAYLDLQLTLGELDRIADKITNFYRLQGYTVARAYIPAQRVEDGLVTVQIVEGKVESVIIKSPGRYGREFVEPYLTPLLSAHPGGLVTDAALERQLLLLNDLPGMRARATLAPGQAFGSTVVELDTQEKFIGVSLGANNSGSRETGRVRLDGSVEVNNPFKLGDQFTLRAIRSSDQLFEWHRLGYSLPLGTQGLKLAISSTATDYRLGGQFAALQIAGEVRSADATISYPFVRTRAKNVIGALQWRQTSSRQSVLGLPFSESSLPLLTGSVYMSWVGEDSSAQSVSAAVSTNALKRGSDSVRGAYGEFAKLDAEWTYLTGAARNWDFFFRGRGVFSTSTLPDTEKFSLGGESSVRGYSSAILRGDFGFQGTFELRRQFMVASTPGYGSVFWDVGGARNKGFLGYDKVSSLGVGWTHYLGRRGQVKLEYARPLDKVFGREQPARVWASMNVSF